MVFLEEKKISMSTISKSFAENYDTCKLKAWKKKRNNRDLENKYLQIGLAAHEMFAKKIAERIGEQYILKNITDPSIKFEAQNIIKKVDFDKLLSNADIIGYEQRVETLLPNGMSLIGVLDLVLLVDDPVVGLYLHVIDFKTSYVVNKEIDNEAIFYAYLIVKAYEKVIPGIPVTFTRYSGRTHDTWGHFFTNKDALAFEEIITPYASEIKKVIESEEEPFPEAGPHCIQCPFLDECSAKDLDETNPRELLVKLQLHKANVKILEDKLKALRYENEDAIETEEFRVDIKESKSKVVATKNMSKKDLVVLLAKAGKLEEVLNSIDLKITEQVIEKATELGIDFKDRVSKRLDIQPKGVSNE